MKRAPKTYFLKTYGCQMNELDSEIMVGALKHRGMIRTDDEHTADLLLYNTCSIRDLAERKVMGRLGMLARTKRAQEAIIGVAGCMANAKKESLLRKLPHIDFVIGTNNLHDLNTVLDEVVETGQRVVKTDSTFEQELDYGQAERDDKVKAFVSIIRGCDKFCTYCVVPYTRGKEVSRRPDSIIEECKQLVDNGYKEITLLGQNVNSYGKDQADWNCKFHDLLYRLDQIDGLQRIRFMTSHPVDITRELMEAVATLPTLCDFVHFPMQAGSNRILRKMHRIYTIEEYLEKVALFRKILPTVSLGTDIIVGFPSETDEDFEETYTLMKEIEYSVSFIFAFSPRKGTPAMRWRDDIPEEVKKQRLHRLLELQEEISHRQRLQMIGTKTEVLVESMSFKDKRLVKGRTTCWKQVTFPGDESLCGTLQTVNLLSHRNQTLIGEIETA